MITLLWAVLFACLIFFGIWFLLDRDYILQKLFGITALLLAVGVGYFGIVRPLATKKDFRSRGPEVTAVRQR